MWFGCIDDTFFQGWYCYQNGSGFIDSLSFYDIGNQYSNLAEKVPVGSLFFDCSTGISGIR
jgi:hypothetical protein